MGISFSKKSRTLADRFDELIRPHVPALYRAAFKLALSREDAEDIVQDVLTKLYPQTADMERLEALRPWLLRVVYHQFIDHCRKQQRTPTSTKLSSEWEDYLDPDSVFSDTTVLEDGIAEEQESGRIRDALMDLDPDQRSLVILHLWEGFTLEELSGVFDAPVGTLKSRLHRIKAKLKARLCMEPVLEIKRSVNEGR